MCEVEWWWWWVIVAILVSEYISTPIKLAYKDIRQYCVSRGRKD